MLHTPYSLQRVIDVSDIVLNQSHYNTYDSRYFESSDNMDDSFLKIKNDIIRIWHNTIRPFIDALIKDENIYRANPRKPIIFIPEEGIYLNLLGLDSSNIKYFYSIGGIRLLGVDSNAPVKSSSHMSIFNSPVFDPIHKNHYTATTVVLYQNIFLECKKDTNLLNRILLRLVNLIAVSMIDNYLMCNHKVPMNRVFFAGSIDSNKDIILMPETLNISDTRFIFNYYYTLFSIVGALVDIDSVGGFIGYRRVIMLPDIFKMNMTDKEVDEAEEKIKTMTEDEASDYVIGFKQKIYNKIWNLAVSHEEVSDNDYISICSEIMNNTELNIDTEYYDALDNMEAEANVIYNNAEEESTNE